jgi:hypothetical protein
MKSTVQFHSFTFETTANAKSALDEIQRIFAPEDNIVSLDNATLYVFKKHHLSDRIHTHVKELMSDSGFSIEKRNTLKKVGFASTVLASISLFPSFPVLANTTLFIGHWETTYGRLSLFEHPDNANLLVGIYGHRGGNISHRIVGSVQDNVFSGMWYRSNSDDITNLTALENQNSGLVIFAIEDGVLNGSWLYHHLSGEASTLSGGSYWNGVRNGQPHREVVNTETSPIIRFDTTYGEINLTRQGDSSGYIGSYDNGDVMLIQLGSIFGGIWLHNSNRFGSLALSGIGGAPNRMSGRWDYIQGAMRGGAWDFDRVDIGEVTRSYSPYASVDSGSQWLKGEVHTHVINFSGTSQDGAGGGGRVNHRELMDILNSQGLAFAGLTGHECFPGEHENLSGRNSPAINTSDIPENFTPLRVLENQVSGVEPNWEMNHPNSAQWNAATGSMHRIYLDTAIDKGFIVCHPDYYRNIVTMEETLTATAGGQRMLGVEVYNRYGEDRCGQDIESLGSKLVNPFGFEFWDNALSSGQFDYPIWAFSGDDSFLHMHNNSNLPPAVKYRNNKGRVIAALPFDFDQRALEDRQNLVEDRLSSGQFYAVAGNISFNSIDYNNNDHTLRVIADNAVDWYVYHNGEQLGLATNNVGEAFIDRSQSALSVNAIAAEIVTQPGGYTRLEARISQLMTISSIESDRNFNSVWCRPLVVPGDLSSLATAGELLHFTSSNTTPAIIVGSEYLNGETTIYILANGEGQTDGRINPTYYLNTLSPNITMKIVQRAWLQPAWANPSDNFTNVVTELSS